MENYEEDKYAKAKKKVEDIKGFYSHLTVYIVVNIFLILIQMGVITRGFDGIDIPSWSMLSTPFFWGIGLLFHGLYVFQDRFTMFRSWEERKIKEYMEKDEEEFKNTRWD